jgi:hypothetical protein
MKEFVDRYEDRIHGVLSCFDRMLFRGYLPLMSGWAMAEYLNSLDLRFSNLKSFLIENAQRAKEHAMAMAQRQNRPYQYLSGKIRMEDTAKEIAKRDGVSEGLVCIFSIVQPCRSFSFRFEKGRPFVQSARRKCLNLYFYFMDREFGLIHIQLQTWFPMQIQVYVNGHEWLARKLAANQIRYTKLDNAFAWIEDMDRAQRFAHRFEGLKWPAILDKYAQQVVPQLKDVLDGRSYYWVTTQSEYSTDVLFKNRQALSELYPQLISHSIQCFGAQEVMNFLGRKLSSQFQGEIVSDLSSFVCRRIGGCRIKHRVKQNWIKMYDKSGLVLRVETVINNPEEFRVRKGVTRQGKHRMEWVPMRKGVAYLFRYQEVSMLANARYLSALAAVDDPTEAKRDLDRITSPKKDAAGRSSAAFNPLARPDAELFRAVMDGEHCLRGFTNRDIRTKLRSSLHLKACAKDEKKQSSTVSRIFRRFHAHGLIAKIPRTRRWKVTLYGRRVMGTALYIRESDFHRAYPARVA